MAVGYWIIAVAWWVLFAGFTMWLAVTKNREPVPWFLIGLLTGPLAILIVGFAPAIKAEDGHQLAPVWSTARTAPRKSAPERRSEGHQQ